MLSRNIVRPLWPCLLLPMSCGAWLPGLTSGDAPTRGFTVDTTDRNDVVSFWHAVYQASEGYSARMGWTGDYTSTAAGAEGTTSAAFVADTERRLNFFRALCGVAANVNLSSGATVYISPDDTILPAATTTKAAAAQRSAFMISRTYGASSTNIALSHDPAQSCVAWTPAAWNANANGNVAQGYYGPGAIDAFVQENEPGLSSWNAAVGHRRWTLMERATSYASGNSPGSYNSATNKVIPPAATLYVMQKPAELDKTQPAKFVFYPSAGYFPAPLNSVFWSATYPNANFSAAIVTVTADNGSPVVANVVSRNAAYADNTLVWQVSSNAAAQQVTADTKYNVTISGITGEGVPPLVSYSVTLIDPSQLTETPVLSGPATPSSSGGVYRIKPVDDADMMQTGMFLRHAGTWVEGAEDASPAVVSDTNPGYNFLDSTAGYFRTGSKAFHLSSPPYDVLKAAIVDQSFELDREILPGAGAKLNFYYRRGYMTTASRLAVEISSDQGASWSGIGTDLTGTSTGAPDNGFQAAAVNLTASSLPVRVRFRFYYSGSGGLYTYDDARAKPNGIFIDDISTTGCDVLERRALVNTTAETSVTFNSTTANTALQVGQEWWLRERAVMGGHPFPYGPALVVKPVQALVLSGKSNPPAGGGASYTFTRIDTADSYKLQVQPFGLTSWLEGAEADPAPQITDNTASNYDLISSGKTGYFSSGSRSFRLGLSSTTDDEESFVIERTFVPGASTNLKFWSRKGKMGRNQTISAEVSDNDNTWTSVWSTTVAVTTADAAGATTSVPLSDFAGKLIKVRFAVRKASTNNPAWNASDGGVWFDDIQVENAWMPGAETDTTLPPSSSQVRLDTKTAGQVLQAAVPVRMRLTAMKSGATEAEGPYLTVTPTGTPSTGFAAWVAYDFPQLQGGFSDDDDGDGISNGLAYAFALDPTQAQGLKQTLSISADQTLQLSQPLDAMRSGLNYAAEWSADLKTWSSDGVSVQISSGNIVATAPAGKGSRYLRWKISEL